MVTVARPDGKDTPPPYTRSLKLLPWAYCSFSPPRPRRTLGRCRRDGSRRTQVVVLDSAGAKNRRARLLCLCHRTVHQFVVPLCQKPTKGQLSYTWNKNIIKVECTFSSGLGSPISWHGASAGWLQAPRRGEASEARRGRWDNRVGSDGIEADRGQSTISTRGPLLVIGGPGGGEDSRTPRRNTRPPAPAPRRPCQAPHVQYCIVQ